MSTSQNGWPAGINAAEIAPLVVAGVSFPGGIAHHDGAAVVLEYVATQWHYRVEKLRSGWCWGYNMRAVRGSVSGLSNHAGGCALDHNAPLHPRGRPNSVNLSIKQISTIHTILDDVNHLGFGNILRWGGDYQNSPKDAMHVEIVGSESNTLKAANEIAARGMNVIGPWTKVITAVKPAPSTSKARHAVLAATGASSVNVHSVSRLAGTNADAKDVQAVLNRWYPHDKIEEDGVWGDASFALLDRARVAFGIKTSVTDPAARTQTLQKLGLKVLQA